MALIFAGTAPYSPAACETLKDSLAELEGELYLMKPDVLVAVTPVQYDDEIETIDVNIASPITNEAASGKISVDVQFASRLQSKMARYGETNIVSVIAESTVPDEVFLPLQLLRSHLEDVKVVVISTSNASLEFHRQLGEQLHHACLETNSRVAMVAFGHLSQNPTGDALDEVLVKSVKEANLSQVMKTNPDVLEKSSTDLTRPLAVLAGALQKFTMSPQIIADERCGDERQLLVNFGLQ